MTPIVSPPSAFFRRRAAFLALALFGVLSVVFLDQASRVRAAARRAEHLDLLARRPAERESVLEKSFLDGVAALDRRHPSLVEREAGVEILRKRWELDRLRSPWADAYHAWRDVYALYPRPENRWTRRARLMAPAARQRWREEWVARRLPFSEGLLDLEPGESDGYRLLYDAAGRRAFSRAVGLLTSLDVPVRSSPPTALLVPEDRFWEAHRSLLPLVGADENW